MTIRILRGGKPQTSAPAPVVSDVNDARALWKKWRTGAVNAALSGLTGLGAAQFVGVGWKQSLMIAAGCAYGSFCKWFAQHPLPGAE